jgi:hypothetical protein
MRKWKGIFALGVAMLLIAGASGIARAADGELKVNGFAAILFPVLDQNTDGLCTDHKGDPANCLERFTTGWAEVDFDYTQGPVKFRLDLDVPSLGNEATGFASSGGDVGIEQARFDWMVPGGEAYNLTVTGGAFNAPIGFEAQDDPDMYQITYGQLFLLVPSNLAGFMVSGSQGPVSGGIFYGNDFRGTTDGFGSLLGEENTVGVHVNVAPIEQASLDLTYLSAPYGGDDDIFDAVLTGTGELAPMVTGLLSGEYLHDRNNDAFAIVANVMHNTETYPHGLTIRFDSVDCGKDGSSYCGPDQKPTSITLAGTVYLAESLSTVLEWNRFDPDVSGIDSFDQLLLEFVATFG